MRIAGRLILTIGLLGLLTMALLLLLAQTGATLDERQAAERRARLNPLDPDGWYALGVIQRHDLRGSSPNEARRYLARALGLHPWSYRYWTTMAQIMADLDDPRSATACLRMALSLNRAYSPLYWYAGNYFIRTGDLPSAARCFHQALVGNPALIRPVLAISWRLYSDRQTIIRDIIPQKADMQFGLLNWCIQQDDPAAAGHCWLNLNQLPEVYSPRAAFPYLDYLIRRGEHRAAHDGWLNSLKQYGARPAGEPDNLIFNGGFEQPRWNGGFDWVGRETVHTRFLDTRRGRYQGMHALAIAFDGAENVAGWFLSQRIFVERPGLYRFRYAIRTDPLTSDQGVYFDIIDTTQPAQPREIARGDRHLAEESWRLCTVLLEVKTPESMLQVRLRRDRSTKFDNLLKGRIWLDAVELTAEEAR